MVSSGEGAAADARSVRRMQDLRVTDRMRALTEEMRYPPIRLLVFPRTNAWRTP